MSNRSLAETLVLVSLLFISGLSVRACSGVFRYCSGYVRVPFGLCSGTVRVLYFGRVLGMCQKSEQFIP